MLRSKLLHSSKRCLSLALAVVACSTLPALAVERPDTGQIADSVKERKLALPPKANVKIEVENQQETPLQKEGYKIQVTGFRITGQTIYSEDKLQELIKDSRNQELTLSELEVVARRIAQYFKEQGYMVANAFIPAQDIKDGIVEITVAPGRYGGLDIRNHSRLSDKTAEEMLSNIKSGDYVKKGLLDRVLLLMSDTGGISIKATLAPGQANGTSDLIVEISDTNELTSEFSMDNYGNRYTGQDRRNLKLNYNNLSGKGDVLNLDGDNSGGGMNNFNLGYALPVGRQGARVGVGYSQLHYTLGQDFEALDAHGTDKTTTLYGMYPLVRSRNYDLYSLIEYDHRKLQDRIDQYNSLTDKHADVWTFGLMGNSRDKFHGGGVNNFALNIISGRLTIDGGQDMYSIPAKTVDSEGLQTAGSYTKASLTFNRLQYINDRLNVYLGFTGQLASKNLDSSEKLFIGGANGVRAYPQGEAAGDQGYLLTGELRWSLPTPSLQLAAFVDGGSVKIDKNPITSSGDNRRTLAGAGLGLILNSRKDYTVRVDYAWKISSSAATADIDKNGRWWVKGTQYF
jgi:hemolysin activation/secretion protein